MGKSERWKFDLCGGHVALDLANTVGWRHTDRPIDHLQTYDELVEFGGQTRLYSRARQIQLRAWAARTPAAARRVFRRAIALREALYRMFASQARRTAPTVEDLAIFNRELSRMHLDPRYTWRWHAGDDAADAILGTIARAAADLLTSPRRGNVRLCAADDCIWVFLDSSKNGSRRWCDMNQCGNRAKARRFYDRRNR